MDLTSHSLTVVFLGFPFFSLRVDFAHFLKKKIRILCNSGSLISDSFWCTHASCKTWTYFRELCRISLVSSAMLFAFNHWEKCWQIVLRILSGKLSTPLYHDLWLPPAAASLFIVLRKSLRAALAVAFAFRLRICQIDIKHMCDLLIVTVATAHEC